MVQQQLIPANVNDNMDNEKVATKTLTSDIFSEIETQATGSSGAGCSGHWPCVTCSCSNIPNLLMFFPT